MGIVADANSPPNIYVADTDNSVIRAITPTGVVTSIAGGGLDVAADGIGNTASFDSPAGITITSVGVLIVADT